MAGGGGAGAGCRTGGSPFAGKGGVAGQGGVWGGRVGPVATARGYDPPVLSLPDDLDAGAGQHGGAAIAGPGGEDVNGRVGRGPGLEPVAGLGRVAAARWLARAHVCRSP